MKIDGSQRKTTCAGLKVTLIKPKRRRRMTVEKGHEVAERGNFNLVDPSTIQQNIKETFEGLTPQFVIIKVPPGGGTNFEVDEDAVKTIDGVVICHYTIRLLFLHKMSESQGEPPACISQDGITGVGKGEKVCINCKYNQPWSFRDYIDNSEKSIRHACQEKHRVFILRSGEFLPMLVSLPFTSIKPFSIFMTKVTLKGKNPKGVIISIGLEKTKSKGGIEFSKCTFKVLGDIPDDQKSKIISLAKFLNSYCRTKPVEAKEKEYDEDFPPEE